MDPRSRLPNVVGGFRENALDLLGGGVKDPSYVLDLFGGGGFLLLGHAARRFLGVVRDVRCEGLRPIHKAGNCGILGGQSPGTGCVTHFARPFPWRVTHACHYLI